MHSGALKQYLRLSFFLENRYGCDVLQYYVSWDDLKLLTTVTALSLRELQIPSAGIRLYPIPSHVTERSILSVSLTLASQLMDRWFKQHSSM